MQNLPLLRTSERIAFRRCPQRWWWGWRQGLKPQGPPNDKLWFGQGVHLALALWYKPGQRRGIDPRKTWKKFVADDIAFIKTEFGSKDPSAYEEAGAYGEELLGWYVEHYGRDRKWDVIAPEQTFEVKVPDFEGNPIVRLVGTFDGVYRDLDDGRLKLMEHKTAAQIYTGHLELDDQGGTYATVATHTCREQGLIGSNESIDEITYNFLRKGRKDERPVNEQGLALNKDGTVSKNQPTPLFRRETVSRSRKEQRSQLERIASEVEIMNLFREGELDLYKNPTRDCSWDCEFYEMCVLHESNPEDALEFRNAVFRVEDPYADHRKAA